MTENEMRILLRDYLNGELKEQELLNIFELEKCEQCGNYNLKEDLFDTETIIDGGIGYICESCSNDI